jgi:hypothetical protein
MNTFFRSNGARNGKHGQGSQVRRNSQVRSNLWRPRTSSKAAITAALTTFVLVSIAACAQPMASVSSAKVSESPSAAATAPATTSCDKENATEKYPPNVFICTKTDAGKLLWMDEAASKKVTDARTAAAAKAAADKAAADKAAQEAAAKAAAEKAAAEKAAQDAAAKAAQEQAAAEAARQQQAAAAAAAAAAKAPVQQVAPAAPSGCDPNYAGACVPIASDVDCAGGSGNGPAYVRGPVTVIGRDIYGLDSDGNGIGCEK